MLGVLYHTSLYRTLDGTADTALGIGAGLWVILVWRRKRQQLLRNEAASENTSVLRNGSCECAKVRFKVLLPAAIEVQRDGFQSKIRFPSLPIMTDDFDLQSDQDALSMYYTREGPASGINVFCSSCGVNIMYSASRNPHEIRINADCLDRTGTSDWTSICSSECDDVCSPLMTCSESSTSAAETDLSQVKEALQKLVFVSYRLICRCFEYMKKRSSCEKYNASYWYHNPLRERVSPPRSCACLECLENGTKCPSSSSSSSLFLSTSVSEISTSEPKTFSRYHQLISVLVEDTCIYLYMYCSNAVVLTQQIGHRVHLTIHRICDHPHTAAYAATLRQVMMSMMSMGMGMGMSGSGREGDRSKTDSDTSSSSSSSSSSSNDSNNKNSSDSSAISSISDVGTNSDISSSNSGATNAPSTATTGVLPSDVSDVLPSDVLPSDVLASDYDAYGYGEDFKIGTEEQKCAHTAACAHISITATTTTTLETITDPELLIDDASLAYSPYSSYSPSYSSYSPSDSPPSSSVSHPAPAICAFTGDVSDPSDPSNDTSIAAPIATTNLTVPFNKPHTLENTVQVSKTGKSLPSPSFDMVHQRLKRHLQHHGKK